VRDRIDLSARGLWVEGDDMQRAMCAVGVDQDGHVCHPFLRFGRRQSLLSFLKGALGVLSRQWSLGRLEREKLVDRSCVVQGEWNEVAVGRPYNPLRRMIVGRKEGQGWTRPDGDGEDDHNS